MIIDVRIHIYLIYKNIVTHKESILFCIFIKKYKKCKFPAQFVLWFIVQILVNK